MPTCALQADWRPGHFLNGFIKYCNEHTGTWKATRTARDPLGVLLPTDKHAIIQGQSFPAYQDERGWYYLIRRDPGTVKVTVEKQSAKHCH